MPHEPSPSPRPATGCPFHDGHLTIDLLLGELDKDETAAQDTALDLRQALSSGEDAAACVDLLFQLRACIGERHYLAFYRVRCMLWQSICAQVRPSRSSPWLDCHVPQGCARTDELINSCLASLADEEGLWPSTALVRFIFRNTLPTRATP